MINYLEDLYPDLDPVLSQETEPDPVDLNSDPKLCFSLQIAETGKLTSSSGSIVRE